MLESIDELKILDPACGSGAFPMGVLHKLVYLLSKLDPKNEEWEKIQLTKVQELADVDERRRKLAEIANNFAENNDDYGRKLYLIENCLYGVDIQPTAIQITKLRFFISLVCDQKTNRNKKENHGIRPLPNLETKFVTANTLIGLPISEKDFFIESLLDTTEKEIESAYHAHFTAQRRDQKLALQKRIKALRQDLAATLESSLGAANSAKAKYLASWDPFDPQSTAEFFDPHWMFGRSLKDGFDIVIGNPPYISVEKFARTKHQETWKKSFKTFAARGDIYCFFYERGFALLKEDGVLCLITSNKFLKAAYGKTLRELLIRKQIEVLIDFCELPVFEAATDPIIVITTNTTAVDSHEFPALVVKDESEFTSLSQSIKSRASLYKSEHLKPSGWSLEGASGLALVEKLRSNGVALNKHVEGQLHLGIRTGLNKAFIIDQTKRDQLIEEDPRAEKLIKPWIRGRDIKRWTHAFEKLYVIIVPHKFHAELKNYPSIRRHLSSFESDLKARGQCQSSRNGTGEAQHHWLELDNNPSTEYISAFETPKIVIADIGKCLKASWAEPKYFLGNTGYFIANAKKYTLAILLSRVIDWYARMTFQGLGDPWEGGRLRFINRNLVTIPIPAVKLSDQTKLNQLVQDAAHATSKGDGNSVKKIEQQIDEVVYRLFDLTPEEISMIDASLAKTSNLTQEDIDDEGDEHE